MIDQTATPISFSIFDVRSVEGQIIPLMCTDGPAGPRIENGLLRFARHLRRRGDGVGQVRAKCFALGLFRDFFLYAWSGDLTQPRALIELTAEFFRARRIGLDIRRDNGQPSLRWAPVRRDTVRRDRYAIVEFGAFCVSDFEAFTVLPLDDAQAAACRADLERLLVLRVHSAQPSDLLYHLHRARGARTDLILRGGRPTVRRTTQSKPHFQLDDVRRVIDRTRCSMQKMLLIQGFFGGPRLSEMLHQWRCDVLPGRYRRELFPDDRPSNVVLSVLAHPEEGTFTGGLQDRSRDRLQHLAHFYGRRPRTMLEGSTEAAGWKSIAFDNPHTLLAQIFWANLNYAQFFADLYDDVKKRIYSAVPPEILEGHPYLFINADPRQKEFGRPLKMGNARKIFQRAAARIEGAVSIHKDGSHGARHFYKSLIETALPDQYDDIAKCMHHMNVKSQEDYAKNSVAARQRLFTALQGSLAS